MEENLNTNPAIQPQDGQNNSEKQPSEQNLQQGTQVEHKTTPQESFQELRHRAEQAERERNEAIGFIQRLEHHALQQQQLQQQKPEPEPEPISYDDDDIIEGRHIKPELAAIRKELQEHRRYAEEARRIAQTNSMENAIRSKYNDFDSVVTRENVEKLRALKPELAESLHRTPDDYNKAVAVYTILKDLGIARSNVSYNEDHIKAQNNLSKPRTSATLASQTGTTSLSHASAFTDGKLTAERKDQIYKTMLANAKQR
jgi:hypothetical protein